MRNVLVAAVFLLIAGVMMGADAPAPKEIQAAVLKCDEAVKKAQDAYRKAVVAAKTELLGEVKVQLAAALKAGKVEAVKALDETRKELEEEIRFMSLKGVHFQVDSRTFTKVSSVKKGQVFGFEARGKWKMGPDIAECDADGVGGAGNKVGRLGYLIARIAGKNYILGKSKMLTVSEDGEMEIGPFDLLNRMDDNSGSLDVVVTQFK